MAKLTRQQLNEAMAENYSGDIYFHNIQYFVDHYSPQEFNTILRSETYSRQLVIILQRMLEALEGIECYEMCQVIFLYLKDHEDVYLW